MGNRNLGIHGGSRPIDFTDVSTDELEELVGGAHGDSMLIVVERLGRGQPVRLREVLDEATRRQSRLTCHELVAGARG